MLKKIWFHSFIFIHFVRNFVSHTKVPVFSEICLYYKSRESSDHFWGNWAQNGLPDITLEQHIQFSQAAPHFVWNFVSHTRLPVYFKNLALLGAWYLVTTFGAIRPKMVYLTLLWGHTFNFHKQPLILFEILFCTPSCQFISEIWLY